MYNVTLLVPMISTFFLKSARRQQTYPVDIYIRMDRFPVKDKNLRNRISLIPQAIQPQSTRGRTVGDALPTRRVWSRAIYTAWTSRTGTTVHFACADGSDGDENRAARLQKSAGSTFPTVTRCRKHIEATAAQERNGQVGQLPCQLWDWYGKLHIFPTKIS